MKNLKFWTGKNNEFKHEIWCEEMNGTIYYWERINGIANQITKRKFENLQKKYS